MRHMKYWRRYRAYLALIGMALALVFSAPAPAQEVIEPQLIPIGHVQNLSVGEETLAWGDARSPITGDIFALRLDNSEIITIADGPAIQTGPRTNDEAVIWLERPERTSPDGPLGPRTLRGYNLATRETFLIAENLPSGYAPEQVLEDDLAGWVERTDAQEWRVMARNIRTLEPAFAVATGITLSEETSFLRLNLDGTTFLWYEERPGASDPLPVMFRDISTMDAPQQLITIAGQRFVDGGIVWWDDQRRLYHIQPGDAEPTLLATDPLGPLEYGAEHAVYIGERGLTLVRLADGTSRVLDSSVLVGGPPVTDGNRTCWTRIYADVATRAARERLLCHDHVQQQTIELPFLLPEDKRAYRIHFADDRLVWLSSGANPRAEAILGIVSMSEAFAALPPAAPPQITEPAFQQLWARHDRPVAAGTSQRSWTWGPQPLTPTLPRNTLPDDMGILQYFDKARMEINDPQANPNDPWYVTTGLLPVELMTGDYQRTAGLTGARRDGPARLAAVGDPGNFPTYADLGMLFDRAGRSPAAAFGQPITTQLTRDGMVDRTGQSDFTADPNTVLVDSPTGADYGVPRAFATFMTQAGPVFTDNQFVTMQLFDPLFVFGFPVTEPVWVDASVGGTRTPVLVQIFERRVLTYNPANPSAWRVEMGNVGRHYLLWRGY